MKSLYLVLAIGLFGGMGLKGMYLTQPQFQQFDTLFHDLTTRYIRGEAITATQLETILGAQAQAPINWNHVIGFIFERKDLILRRAEGVLEPERNPLRGEILNALAGLKIIRFGGLERIPQADSVKVTDMIGKLEERLHTRPPMRA